MEMKEVGVIIMSAVAIIVCISLLIGSGISSNVGEMTTLRTVTNSSGTQHLIAGTGTVTLQGKEITDFAANNRSTGAPIPATNYTVNNNVILSDNTLGAQVTWKSGDLVGSNVNVTYTYQPLGYVPDSGGRAVSSLIIIFAALVIAVIAIAASISPTLLSQIKDVVTH